MGQKKIVNNYYSPMVFNVPTPKTLLPIGKDAVPAMLLLTKTIQNETSQRLLSVLFDSGGMKTMIHKKCLPLNA